MHEASLAQGLLELVLEAAAAHSGPTIACIKEIRCEAGLLAGFEPQTLTDCFLLFAEDTPAAGARLHIETAPLDCVCGECGAKFRLARRRFACPACGSGQIDFRGGHGLVLKAISVESEE